MNALSVNGCSTTTDKKRLQARARRLAKKADTLVSAGRFVEAIACQNELVALRPDDVTAVLRLGLLYREIQCIDAAIVAFQQATTICPHLCDPREALIETFLEAEMYNAAIEEGRALIKLDPRNVFARDVLSVAYLQIGLPEKALHMMTEMTRLDPLNPGHHFKRALLLQQQGNLNDAVSEYARTRDLASAESELYSDASDALEALDNYQLHQILILAKEDKQFCYLLYQNTADAVEERGFALSLDGLMRMRSFLETEDIDTIGYRSPYTVWGGVKFYN